MTLHGSASPKRVVVNYEGLKEPEIRADHDGVHVHHHERISPLERILVEELRNGSVVTVRDIPPVIGQNMNTARGISFLFSPADKTVHVGIHDGRTSETATRSARRLLEDHGESSWQIVSSHADAIPPGMPETHEFGPFREDLVIFPGAPPVEAGHKLVFRIGRPEDFR